MLMQAAGFARINAWRTRTRQMPSLPSGECRVYAASPCSSQPQGVSQTEVGMPDHAEHMGHPIDHGLCHRVAGVSAWCVSIPAPDIDAVIARSPGMSSPVIMYLVSDVKRMEIPSVPGNAANSRDRHRLHLILPSASGPPWCRTGAVQCTDLAHRENQRQCLGTGLHRAHLASSRNSSRLRRPCTRRCASHPGRRLILCHPFCAHPSHNGGWQCACALAEEVNDHLSRR